MSNRTLLILALVLGAGYLFLRARSDMSTAELYGTGPRTVIGGHYGGGQ